MPNIGRHRVRLLVSNMGMDINPFELSIKELCTVNGIDKKSAEQIKNYKDFDYGIQELEAAEKFGISIVSFWDDHYPMLLKKIYNPPVILYCKGQPLQYKEDVVAIVGTRRFTPYGKSVTQKLTSDLISNNITIVSGLARGIDTIAHKTSVEGGGRTISVLGSGMDVLYPAENKKLA